MVRKQRPQGRIGFDLVLVRLPQLVHVRGHHLQLLRDRGRRRGRCVDRGGGRQGAARGQSVALGREALELHRLRLQLLEDAAEARLAATAARGQAELKHVVSVVHQAGLVVRAVIAKVKQVACARRCASGRLRGAEWGGAGAGVARRRKRGAMQRCAVRLRRHQQVLGALQVRDLLQQLVVGRAQRVHHRQLLRVRLLALTCLCHGLAQARLLCECPVAHARCLGYGRFELGHDGTQSPDFVLQRLDDLVSRCQTLAQLALRRGQLLRLARHAVHLRSSARLTGPCLVQRHAQRLVLRRQRVHARLRFGHGVAKLLVLGAQGAHLARVLRHELCAQRLELLL
eukprot:Unigene16240_Nuclearia_a/m.48199 Unigene16240_Nuclearia_a/g.48199  ORF Unigene16240_Nuclearia_a/g.48199 Unigene16240_Nuclearia_a/m.48199 type:complete len:342 (-) Unigene16240_Nuclearia_a:499-1524(-)